MKFNELCRIIEEHNEKNNITKQFGDKKPLRCRIVFSNDSYVRNYDLLDRTYEFRSDNKYFIKEMYGDSIFADCVGYNETIRLDWYLDEWIIEDCYIIKP